MPDEEIEQQVANLPRGSATGSFRVFAEWLKDNRNALERRLDAQDRKLEEIHGETRRTNGRVTQLETDVRLQEALKASKTDWKHERQAELEDRADRDERMAARRERRRQFWIATAFVVVGGIAGELGRSIGIW